MTLKNTILVQGVQIEKLTAERDKLKAACEHHIQENWNLRNSVETLGVDLGLAESSLLRFKKNMDLLKEAYVAIGVKMETGKFLESVGVAR